MKHAKLMRGVGIVPQGHLLRNPPMARVIMVRYAILVRHYGAL